MKKGLKVLIGLIVLGVLLVVFKNQISLGLMNIVDFIGVKTGWNVIEVIDFLNNIYYL